MLAHMHRQMDGTTAALLYPLCNTLRGDNNDSESFYFQHIFMRIEDMIDE